MKDNDWGSSWLLGASRPEGSAQGDPAPDGADIELTRSCSQSPDAPSPQAGAGGISRTLAQADPALSGNRPHADGSLRRRLDLHVALGLRDRGDPVPQGKPQDSDEPPDVANPKRGARTVHREITI